MERTVERMEFQAEARRLLDLMIHSLYKHEEIFLRELISNAADALDKLRFEALTRPELLEGDERLAIRLDADPVARTLTIRDNGIGMDRDEVIANLGTIARSGTREFLQKLQQARAEGAEAPDLIGQFGVGFYSAFMVADEVTVETRRAGAAEGVRWTSTGDGAYTVEPIEKADRGTTITLKLKPRGADDERQDFTQEHVLRDVVKRYSDFIPWPIEMEVLRSEGEGSERTTVRRVETLNSMKPLWTRSPSEITADEYAEFYKRLTHDWEPPLETIHFRAEGTLEYTALLFLPARRPPALFDPHAGKAKLQLYVRRVFIMDDCEELLPPWLRFVRGVVDSNDLPLNVSRETLQHDRQVRPIRKRLVAKTLDVLRKMLADDRAKYAGFFREFGPVLKEGIWGDDDARQDIASICLFANTREEEPCTLQEYVERMPFKQKEIYVFAGQERAQTLKSPHLEALRAKGYEVLLLLDPVDEFAMQRLGEFQGKPIRAVEKGDVDVEEAPEKEAREAKQKEMKPLLERLKEALGGRVQEVRFSSRLTDSAAILVTEEDGLTPQMARLLKEARQEVPEARRALELNANHPVVARLEELRGGSAVARFQDYVELLYGQALLAEGSPLPDPAAFNQLVSRLMVDR